jgi:peroxiredoxin Q/BCP
MSKKMRKKSSKPSTGKVTHAKPQGPKKPSRKTSRATSSPTGKSSTVRASAPRPESSRGEAQKPSKPAPSHDLAGPAEGTRAPAFELPRDGGTRLSLADFAGRKLVIFFYPRADTPGCTREAIDFTRLEKAFATCGTAVLGVSADPIKAQESFRTKHKLSIPLMSDETHGMLEAYGAWGEKSMYGRTFLGILRTTVLINKEGRIAKVWRKVKVDGHADEVLAAAQGL